MGKRSAGVVATAVLCGVLVFHSLCEGQGKIGLHKKLPQQDLDASIREIAKLIVQIFRGAATVAEAPEKAKTKVTEKPTLVKSAAGPGFKPSAEEGKDNSSTTSGQLPTTAKAKFPASEEQKPEKPKVPKQVFETIRFGMPAGWAVTARHADPRFAGARFASTSMHVSGAGSTIVVQHHPGFATAPYTPEGIAQAIIKDSWMSGSVAPFAIGAKKHAAVKMKGKFGQQAVLFQDGGKVYMIAMPSGPQAVFDHLVQSVEIGALEAEAPTPAPAPKPKVLGQETERPPAQDRSLSREELDAMFQSVAELIASIFNHSLFSDPNFTSSAYRESNPLWRAGYAPNSARPSNPQLGSAEGNCTWYANGRLREFGYSAADLEKLVGNAKRWDEIARSLNIPVDQTPRVGAIAQWNTGFGGYGHVAVVERVNVNGTILISESSYAPNSPAWDFLYRTRTIEATNVQNFIHVRR